MIRIACTVCIICVAISLAGCSNSGITLGPKPADYASDSSHAEMSDVVDDLRAWLGSLDTEQLQTLEKEGVLKIDYAILRQTDTEHARLVDLTVEMINSYYQHQASSFEVPPTPPETLLFIHTQAGAYEFRIEYPGGNALSNLPIADPLQQ